jgi:hypothetical protein
MSYNGKHPRGYARTLRELKREEAEARNALTIPERTKRYRTDEAYREQVQAEQAAARQAELVQP